MKISNSVAVVAAVLTVVVMPMQQVQANNVEVTPLGSNNGEFCQLDRAMLFQDPDGTRILYDPGRTVAGADDPRLGRVDAILLSHIHGDHVGDRHIASASNGDCSTAKFPINALPNTSLVNIALAKDAKIVTGSEMPKFFANKLASLGGSADNSLLVRFGASRKIGGVTITTVPAVHSNGVSGDMVGGELGELLNATGLNAYVGPPTGYVLTFTNGLVVYLSGDTGVTAEQDTVVRRLYGAKLVVINIGDTFTTGPSEAAWVVNKLIKPKSVIPSHANQPSTKDGVVIAGSRVDTFTQLVKASVHVPISGRTMSFDKKGKCVAGC